MLYDTGAMDKQPLGPILTAHLIPEVESKLLELLGQLTPEDWETPTISPKWKVKDVAAHLLDTQLRKLSIARDRHVTEIPVIHSAADLAAFIDRLNQEGVTLYRRLSPTVLISLMEVASTESAKYHQSLDPFATATFAVSWAGEETSPNWFDTARELTERWHHQQQIRLAVNRPGIMMPELYQPVLDCWMRALPYTYRNILADPGTLLQFDISGECGGTWCLLRQSNGWQLVRPSLGKATSRVTIPQEIAWRVFTKGIDRKTALAQAQVEGDSELGLHILQMIAIVA
jgi:uncharacterized protein (TIGR03083 family)